MKPPKKYYAFNTRRILVMIFMFAFMLFLAITTFSEQEYVFFVFFLICALLPIVCFLISPMYMVFTEVDVTIVYLWGIKERILWEEVRSVCEGSMGSECFMTDYQIAYPVTKKYPFFVKGEIPKTFRTKKLLKRFCGTKIV